jgi:hypothetical protein
VFWASSPRELEVLFKSYKERDRQSFLRAGLIAATIVNVNRRKGTALVQPGDFLREAPRAEDYLDADAARAMMDGWASTVNKEKATDIHPLPDLELRDE